MHFIFSIIANISVQLADMFVPELIVLQFHNNIAMEQAVVKNQIRKVVFAVYYDAFLTSLKTETFTHFQQELLQMSYYRFFNIVLCNDIFCLKAKKLESVGISQLKLQGLLLYITSEECHRFHLVFGKTDTDMQIGCYLPTKLTDTPRPSNTFRLIEKSYQRIFNGKEFPNMRKRKCRNKLFGRSHKSI